MAIAEEATLVLIPAVLIQLVAVVEPRAAKATQWMAAETCLVGCAWFIVAVAHVLGQLLVGKHIVLMCEDFLVAGTEITHLLVVDILDMAVEVLPAQTGKIALKIGTVISQQQHGVADNVLASISNANVIVRAGDIGIGKVLEALCRVVTENDKRCGSLAT